jgi:hypothetical protein
MDLEKLKEQIDSLDMTEQDDNFKIKRICG